MRSLVAFNLKTFCKIPRPVWLVCGTLIQTAMLFKIFSLTSVQEYQQSIVLGGIFLCVMVIYIFRLGLENPKTLYRFFKTYKHKDLELNQQIDKLMDVIYKHLDEDERINEFKVTVQNNILSCELQRHFDETDVVITSVNGEQISSSLSAYRMLMSYYLKQHIKNQNDILPVKEALIHVW